MRHFALIRWIRGLLPSFLIIAILAITACVIWIITAGFPPPLLRFVEKELAQQGIYLKMNRVRLDLFNGLGLVARDLAVYEQPPLPTDQPLVRISRARLDFSIDNVWSGKLSTDDLKKLEFKGGFISIPLNDKKDAAIPSYLEIDNLSGEIVQQPGGIVELGGLAWDVKGVEFLGRGRILLGGAKQEEGTGATPIPSSPDEGTVGAVTGGGLLTPFLDRLRNNRAEIIKWQEYSANILLPKEKPPIVKLDFEANVNNWKESRLSLDINSDFIETQGYRLKNVQLEANYQFGVISVEKFFFRDSAGYFHWEGSYMVNNALLEGKLSSTILWEPIREAFFKDYVLPYGLKFSYPVGVTADAKISLDPEKRSLKTYQISGEISSKNMYIAGVELKNISGAFSLAEGNVYLHNMNIELKDSRLAADVLYKDNTLKLNLESDIPLEIYLALAKELGSEIKLPDDLNLSGIPRFKTGVSVHFPQKEGDPMEFNGQLVLEGQKLVYRDYGVENFILKTELKKVRHSTAGWDAEGGLVDLVCEKFEGAGDLFLSKMNVHTVFDRLVSKEGEAIDNRLEVTGGIVDLQCDEFREEHVKLDKLQLAARCTRFTLPHEEGAMFLVDNGNLKVDCTNLDFREMKFTQLALESYYENGEGYVPRLAAITPEKREFLASAKLQDNRLSVKLSSSLLLDEIYRLTRSWDVDHHNKLMNFGRNGKLNVDAEASINLNDWNDYKISGTASAYDAKYNGVPLESASTGFSYIPHELSLTNSKLVFLYDEYDMIAKTKVSPAPKKGTFTAKSIVNDELKSTIKITDLTGKAYPEPLLNMFAPQVGVALKQFMFHSAPNVRANGTIDISDPKMARTEFHVAFDADKVDYVFMGKMLNLSEASGNVHIRREKLYLNNLKANMWGGQAEARLGVQIANGESYDGSLTFTSCDLKKVGSTFGWEVDSAVTSASLNFDCPGGSVKKLKGNGKAEINEGNLLNIPFFGPLTTVFDMTFGLIIPKFKELTGAKITHASCTFNILDGHLVSKDFLAKGKNMRIEGVSSFIDLEKVALNMDIKVDLKGIIGWVLLPVSLPLGGFPFHGEGPLENPTWSARFLSEDYKAK